MIDLLILLVLNSLLCTGLYSAWQFEYKYVNPEKRTHLVKSEAQDDTKGILWFYKYHILDASWMNYRISKPLGNCLTCMASVFSIIPYWFYYDWNFTNFGILMLYPVYILMLAGINRLIDQYING